MNQTADNCLPLDGDPIISDSDTEYSNPDTFISDNFVENSNFDSDDITVISDSDTECSNLA